MIFPAQPYLAYSTFWSPRLYQLHWSLAPGFPFYYQCFPGQRLNISLSHHGKKYIYLGHTVLCEGRVRGFFRRASSFPYISRQGMTSLDLCLQLIPPGQGNQPRHRQPTAGLIHQTSPITKE